LKEGQEDIMKKIIVTLLFKRRKHMKKQLTQIIVAVLFIVSMLPITGFSSKPTYWPVQEWRVSMPEEQGVDSTLISEMLEHITQQQIDIHSLLIIRNGYLVTEAYFSPYSKEIPHPLYSCTKSFTSALVGIALKDGYIKGVEQNMLEFFDNKTIKDLDSGKKEITLAHLLTMTSGLKPTPSFPLFQYAEPIPFVLNLPMTHKPGEEFAYNSAAVHLLSAIIRQTTGTEVLSYANKKLFTPLGISDITWDADSTGLQAGPTGLRLTPRDLAKFGYLYLRNGIWDGKQVISKEWIEVSTQQHVDTTGKMNTAEDEGYGYLWWMNDFGGYSSHGFGGQYLFVIPDLDLIIVFTSGLEDPLFPTPKELVEAYLLPAVRSPEPITPNPQAFRALKAIVEKLGHPEPEPVAPFPEIAKQISGKTFQITQDGSGGQLFKTISFTFMGNDVCTAETLWSDGRSDVLQGGLDNVFRMNDFEVNQRPVKAAFKGSWQDDHTFVAYVKDMSQVDTAIHTYTFEGKKLSIDINSSMNFYSFQSIGEMVE
jgi:CubicO group peptidase (beta-lactamase class C family)